MALIELGLVDGMAFSSSSVDAIEAAINQCAPAGTVVMTIAAAAPTGWLFLAGQVVVNAQTLYPDLWAVAPAGWKSGTSLTLPNATSRFPIGGATPGVVGGSNSHTLTQAELPAATIAIDPPNTAISIDPPPTAVTGSTGGATVRHTHPQQGFNGVVIVGTIGSGSTVASAGSVQTGNDAPDHGHVAGTLTVDIAPFNANVDIAPFASSPLGSGTPMDVTPAFFTVGFLIKAH